MADIDLEVPNGRLQTGVLLTLSKLRGHLMAITAGSALMQINHMFILGGIVVPRSGPVVRCCLNLRKDPPSWPEKPAAKISNKRNVHTYIYIYTYLCNMQHVDLIDKRYIYIHIHIDIHIRTYTALLTYLLTYMKYIATYVHTYVLSDT